jgi:hypothetical protein
MPHCFSYTLSANEKKEIIIFITGFDNYHIEQHPDWVEINYPHKKKCFFIHKNNNCIVCYAVITESYSSARISLGPVGLTEDFIIEAIVVIYNYYKSKHFAALNILLGTPENTGGNQIQEEVFKKIKFSQDPLLNWSTLILDLKDPLESIIENFRKGHKWSIKKANALDLKAREITSDFETTQLAEIYNRLYHSKRLISELTDTKKIFLNIFKYFQSNRNGVFIGVFDNKTKLLGGIILPFQGNTLVYKFGASEPELRNIPILHIAFVEAIRIAKEKGIRFLDFGGYMPNAKNPDQVFFINYFKKGFSGTLLPYPDTMIFTLNLFKSKGLKIIKYLYQLIRKQR